MLTLAYAFNFIDRQILVILQQSIKDEMGLMDWQLGLLSGFAFALVYVTAGIPIAYWADRGNRRNIIAIAVTVWSGMTALSGFAQNFGQLLMARVGVGLGEAGGSPPAHAMISDYFPPERRASALGFYSAGLHFGIVLVELRSFWCIAVGCGLTAFGGYGVGNFLPPFMERTHELTGLTLGIVMAIGGGGAGLFGTLMGGRISDSLGTRDRRWYLWLPAIAGTMAFPLIIPMLLWGDVMVVVPLMVVVTALTNTYLGPCLATCHALVPPSMRALTSAILFFVLNLIGLGMGPLTAGLLSDHFTELYGVDGLRYALLCVATISATGVFMFVLGAKYLPGDFERRERLLAESR